MGNDLYTDATAHMGKIGKLANISSELQSLLDQPQEVFEFSVPLRRDDGSLVCYRGYRVRHLDICGPTKGGIRFHPQVDLGEVKALAFWMTLKCSLLHLPYGGGKGGLAVDVKDLSLGELERVSRAYMGRLANFVGVDRDIPAPDMYTNARVMAWMMDEYSKIKQARIPGVITGKPVILGGSLGRNQATGRGAYYCIKELEKVRGADFRKDSFAVQGFGNAGQHVARLLHADGYRVVAISDSRSGMFNPDGLDIPACLKIKQEEGKLRPLPGAKAMSNEELLLMDVEFLLPSAMENQIHAGNVDGVKARHIVELANGPINSAAEEKLVKQGVFIIPDILANAGGVVVSYYEWLQNRSADYWTEEEVFSKLEKRMARSFGETYEKHKQGSLDMRTAAYVCALETLDLAARSFGEQVDYQ